MSTRHRLFGLAVVVIGSLTTAALAAGPADAAPTAAPPSQVSSSTLSTIVHTPTVRPVAESSPGLHASSDCAAVRSQLAGDAARGISQVSCETITPTTTRPAISGAAPAVTPNIADWCSQVPTNTWGVSRSEGCINNVTLTEMTVNSQTGETTGMSTLLISQDIVLSPNTSTFTETDTIFWELASGKAVSTRDISFFGECTGLCTASPAGGVQTTLSPNQTVTASFTYADTPGTGIDNPATFYNFTWSPPPNTIAGGGWSWNGPGYIRCDGQLGSLSGCVFSIYVPTLSLSVAAQGAAAINVAIGELYLPDAYGSNTPLTRQADPALRAANRAAICGGFVPDPNVATDSCDEYPFASSHQSGGEAGLTGADCAQVTATPIGGGSYSLQLTNYTGNEHCLIGHVPNAQNKLVGSALGVFIKANRVIADDPYWVEVDN
jgi:hypothetical protein